MTFKLLETVVLERDLPDRKLRRGDLGAVVLLHEPDGLDVAEGDLLTVRRLDEPV